MTKGRFAAGRIAAAITFIATLALTSCDNGKPTDLPGLDRGRNDFRQPG